MWVSGTVVVFTGGLLCEGVFVPVRCCCAILGGFGLLLVFAHFTCSGFVV